MHSYDNQSSCLCEGYWNSKAIVIISGWSCALYYKDELRTMLHFFYDNQSSRLCEGYWNSKAIVAQRLRDDHFVRFEHDGDDS